jgi:hypothetical protein
MSRNDHKASEGAASAEGQQRLGPALRGAVARHERVRLLSVEERLAAAADLLAAALVQVPKPEGER